jgi:hypothetical protein
VSQPTYDPRYAQPPQDPQYDPRYAQQPPPPAPAPGYDPRYAQAQPGYAPAPPDQGYAQQPPPPPAPAPGPGYQGMPVQGYYQGPPPGAPQPGYQGIPQQGYQGNPWQGNPYAAPELRNPPPPVVQGDLDSFYNQPGGGGRSIASFLHKQVGQSITGVVARPITNADVTQQTDFTSGRGLEFRDGRPKFQMIVPLRVQESIEFPEGKATWYIRGSERDELAAAMARAGAPPGPPEMGAIITITYIGDRQIPNLNAKKLHDIVYRRPDGSGAPPPPNGQQAQVPPQPAPPAPAAPQGYQQQQGPQPPYAQAPQGYQQQGAPPQGYQQGPPPGAPQGYQQGPPPGAPQGYPQQLPGQPPAPQQQGPPPGTPQSAAGQAVQDATQAAMATAGQYQQPQQQYAQPQYAQPGPPAPQAPAAPLPPGVSQADVEGMTAEQLALIGKLAAQQVNLQPQQQ